MLRWTWIWAVAALAAACATEGDGRGPTSPSPAAFRHRGADISPVTSSFLAEQVLCGELSAYSPVPSPDGKRIAFLRNGCDPIHGSGGRGRSNLRSDVYVMDDDGNLLTREPIASAFLAGWTPDGQHLICYRDHQCFLLSLNGAGFPATRTDDDGDFRPHTERVAYLSARKSFVWSDRGIRSKDGVVALRGYGALIVPSPDERFLMAIDPTGREAPLHVFDLANEKWSELGDAVIYPEWHSWDWWKPLWSPWSVDSSVLAFATADNAVVVASPDGRRRTKIATIHESEERRVGLAVPSPNGRFVAWIAFDCKREKRVSGAQVWVAPVAEGAKPIAVTAPSAATTLTLRWSGDRALVFDRLGNEADFGEGSRIVKVTLTDDVVRRLESAR